jgi:hypothetical protein
MQSSFVLSLANGGKDMRLARNVKGLSRLGLVLLLVISFLLGAILSYVFTLGFYASNEYRIPSQNTVALQSVNFFTENATFFNATVFNPTFSPSNVTVQRIEVITADGKVHSTVTPYLPLSLNVGASRTLQCFWDWGNYTGQSVYVNVIPQNGLGSNLKAVTPSMNLTIMSVNFLPSVTAHNFTVSIRNAGSPIPLDVNNILVNGFESLTIPSLTQPLALSNATDALPVNLTISHDWVDLQGQSVTISAETVQGFTAYKTITAPSVTSVISINAIFNASNTNQFNVTLLNAFSDAILEVNEVTASVGGNITVIAPANWTAYPSTKLELHAPTTIVCIWDWNSYRGQSVVVTVGTVQGFQMAKQVSLPS